MSSHSRRTFLGVTAGLAGALSVPGLLADSASATKIDVAVVGGGMSGLYCAMRLKSAGFNVALFEASDRVGGRILSVFLPGVTEHAAEIGAMRLRDTDTVEIKLIDSLLGPVAKVPFDFPTRQWFLRDRILRSLKDPSQLPYRLDPSERAIIKSGKNLLVETIREIADSERLADFPSAVDQGVWEQVIKIRSEEGRNFIVDSNGYSTLTSNWNVAAALPWFEEDFAPDTNYFQVAGGLERLPSAMASAYSDQGGVTYLQHHLHALQETNNGQKVLTFNATAGPRQFVANRVILAMTPAALEQLDPASYILQDKRFQAALMGVVRNPLAKIHLTFQSPWWLNPDLGKSRTVTDLPTRQTYLWGEESGGGTGLTMASFHDGTAIDFWSALATGEAYGPANWIDQARGVDGSPLPASLRRSLPISRIMALEIWDQLQTVYGLPRDTAPPLLGTYRNWGSDPLYGAAMHLWAVGTDAEQTMRYMREPFPGVHVCGEAWSREQGWVKGATSTAEAVLRDRFKLPSYT
ncbi:MAG: FAD-dependent oxidoreductase [Pseudomonadota bacterium]